MKRNLLMQARAGSSMLIVLMVLSTLSLCVITALNFTSQTSRSVERSTDLRQVNEIGDGILDYAFVHWRETCRVDTNIQLPTSSFSSLPMPPTPPPSATAAYTLSNYKVSAADQRWLPLANAAATPVPNYGMSKGTVNYNYIARATLTMPTIGSTSLTVNMRRVFTKAQLSPWNYAIFYVDDLEHHPGVASSVTGWVHTNSKLYTAHNLLSYQSKVSYGDDWEKNFKPGDSRRGTETPTAPSWEQTLPPFRDQGQQPFGLDSTSIFNTTDTSANNDSYRELVEVPTGAADPIGDARYYNQADIKILVNNAGAMTIRRKDDTIVTSASTGNDRKVYDAANAAVNVGATITDKREGATVRLVDVDVATLVASSAAIPGFKGVVYISDQSGSASVKRAVRLKNGATINRDAGITFATDNGLYIQGDYNTGRTGSTEPPSNTGNPATPTVTNYVRKPAAVIADAVMILSNNWKDSNSSASLDSRTAKPTTVNTAIVSGIVPTAGGNYSGGAENFPRLLEDWGGDDFTYYGSMVELYNSKQFTTPWKNTGIGFNVYEPPNRKWYFDANFYTSPPPGTLKLVSYAKGRWFFE